MKARELIALLEKQDPEKEVVYGHRRCGETVQIVYCTVAAPSRVVLS